MTIVSTTPQTVKLISIKTQIYSHKIVWKCFEQRLDCDVVKTTSTDNLNFQESITADNKILFVSIDICQLCTEMKTHKQWWFLPRKQNSLNTKLNPCLIESDRKRERRAKGSWENNLSRLDRPPWLYYIHVLSRTRTA